MKKQLLLVAGLFLLISGCLANPVKDFNAIEAATAVVVNDIHVAITDVESVISTDKSPAEKAKLQHAVDELTEAATNAGKIVPSSNNIAKDYDTLDAKYKAVLHDPFYVFGKILRASLVALIIAAVVICVVFPAATPFLLTVSKFGIGRITAQLHALLPVQNIATADIKKIVAWVKSKFTGKSATAASPKTPPPPAVNQI